MCVAATAKRRRRQAANNYNHLAKQGRPIYKKRASTTQSRRLQQLVERERARQQRKANKK